MIMMLLNHFEKVDTKTANKMSLVEFEGCVSSLKSRYPESTEFLVGPHDFLIGVIGIWYKRYPTAEEWQIMLTRDEKHNS